MNDSLEIPVDRVPLNPPKPPKPATEPAKAETAAPEAATPPAPPPPQRWVGEAIRDLFTWNRKKTVLASAVGSLALGMLVVNAIMNSGTQPPQTARLQTDPTTPTEAPAPKPDPILLSTQPVEQPAPFIPIVTPGLAAPSIEPIPTPSAPLTAPVIPAAPLVAPSITDTPPVVVPTLPLRTAATPDPIPSPIISAAATEPAQTPPMTPASPGRIEVPSLPVGSPGSSPAAPPATPTPIPAPLPIPQPGSTPAAEAPKPTLPTPAIPQPRVEPATTPIPTPRIEPSPIVLPTPEPVGPKPITIPETPAPAGFTLTKQPGDSVARPNSGAETLQPRTGFDVDLHEVRAGETFAAISKLHYGDAKYAEALRAFNRGGDLSRMREVEIPPMYVLRQKYSQYLGAARPAVEPTRTGIEWAGAEQPREKTYTILRDGMTLRDVAAEVYGTSKEWEKIWNVNTGLVPDEKLPVGRVVKLPK